MRKFLLLIPVLLLVVVAIFTGIIAYNMNKKCDTYNVAVGRYAKDGTVDIQYIRICRDSLGELQEIIDTMDYALKNN